MRAVASAAPGFIHPFNKRRGGQVSVSIAEGPEKKRARAARYNASDKGRARHRRYNQSEKGRARYKRYYDLNWFELNDDRDMRRLRQRIAERSALLYGEDEEDVRARLGRGSRAGTPTERRKRHEEALKLIDSRRTAEEREEERERKAKLREGMRAGLRFGGARSPAIESDVQIT
jgi:hypothetical protein